MMNSFTKILSYLRGRKKLDSAFEKAKAYDSNAPSHDQDINRKESDMPPELIITGYNAKDRRESQKLVDLQSVAVLAILVVLLFGQLIQQWGDIYHSIELGDVDQMVRILNLRPKYVENRDEYNRTPLHFSVELGQYDVAEALLGGNNGKELMKKAHVDARDNQGLTPLHLAVHEQSESFVALLLRKGASPVKQDESGRSPIYVAVEEGYDEILKLFIEICDDKDSFLNKKWNVAGNEGGTLLHLAAYQDDLERVRLLKEAGADPLIKDDLGRTPYSVAYINANDDVASYLAQYTPGSHE